MSGQAVLNAANKEYFNLLILHSARQFAEYLPHDVTVNIEGDGDKDYIPVEMSVSPAQRMEFVASYVDALDTFGNDLIGRPLSEVFSGCISREQEEALERQSDFNQTCHNICDRIWEVAYTLIVEQKFAESYQAAQMRFVDNLYAQAYEAYYEKRDERGYTDADYDRMADDYEAENEYEM